MYEPDDHATPSLYEWAGGEARFGGSWTRSTTGWSATTCSGRRSSRTASARSTAPTSPPGGRRCSEVPPATPRSSAATRTCSPTTRARDHARAAGSVRLAAQPRRRRRPPPGRSRVSLGARGLCRVGSAAGDAQLAARSRGRPARPRAAVGLGRRAAVRGVTMRAVVLRAPGGPEQLVCEQIATPAPGPGEALMRVHVAAITRDELEWPVDRLPATPSYELSGVIAALGPGADGVAVGDEVTTTRTAPGQPRVVVASSADLARTGAAIATPDGRRGSTSPARRRRSVRPSPARPRRSLGDPMPWPPPIRGYYNRPAGISGP